MIHQGVVLAELQIQSTAEDERQLDEEIHNTVRKIIRDFVTSWFATVSSGSAFERQVHTAMISMATEVKVRAGQVDRKVRGSASGVFEMPEQKPWPLKPSHARICA